MAQAQLVESHTAPVKSRADASILTTYLHNRIRLMQELTRKPRTQAVLNNIRAYLHIVRSLEERYDLSPLLTKASVPKEA